MNRLDIEMSGTLNAEEMKIALDELVDKSKDIQNGKMLYEVIDFHLPSLGAIAIEFSRLPSMLGLSETTLRTTGISPWVKAFQPKAGYF